MFLPSMIEHVVCRCQLLSVFSECRPCCPNSIFDFSRFLVVERDFLTLIFHAFISCQHFDFHVFTFKFLFFVSELMMLWLLRIFVLVDGCSIFVQHRLQRSLVCPTALVSCRRDHLGMHHSLPCTVAQTSWRILFLMAKNAVTLVHPVPTMMP